MAQAGGFCPTVARPLSYLVLAVFCGVVSPVLPLFPVSVRVNKMWALGDLAEPQKVGHGRTTGGKLPKRAVLPWGENGQGWDKWLILAIY